MTNPQAPGFRVCDSSGFHITFANGWTVSVQFGPGNHCEYHHAPFDWEKPNPRRHSYDAEIAAWGPDGNMIDLGGDTVRGWQSPDAVLKMFVAAAAGELASGNIPADERHA